MQTSWRRPVLTVVSYAALSWPLLSPAGVISQTLWSGGSEEAARAYFTATDQSDTLDFEPFDTLGGSRRLTSITYRVCLVATQGWVADNDYSEPTTVYATMTRRATVELPEDIGLFDTGTQFAESDPFYLAADCLPDGSPDVDRTETNQDTTGWQTLTSDWDWSTTQTIGSTDYEAFSGSNLVSLSLQPTRLLWGTMWSETSGDSEVKFTSPGLGLGVELTYEFDPVQTPEPGSLIMLLLSLGLCLRRPPRGAAVDRSRMQEYVLT